MNKRIRQNKKEKEAERVLAMRLFKHGCTKNAMCSVLKIDQRKLAQHLTDTAFSQEGLPDQCGERCIIGCDELPQDIRVFLNAAEDLLVEISADSNRKEGFFRTLTCATLRAEVSQSPEQ